MVLGFLTLGMLPIAIVLVFVQKRASLRRNSLFVILACFALVVVTAAFYHVVGACTFWEAVSMEVRCGVFLLPPKSVPIFYGGAVLGILIFVLSSVKGFLRANK